MRDNFVQGHSTMLEPGLRQTLRDLVELLGDYKSLRDGAESDALFAGELQGASSFSNARGVIGEKVSFSSTSPSRASPRKMRRKAQPKRRVNAAVRLSNSAPRAPQSGVTENGNTLDQQSLMDMPMDELNLESGLV